MLNRLATEIAEFARACTFSVMRNRNVHTGWKAESRFARFDRRVACRYVACGGFPISGINFVNIPLRLSRTRGIKDEPSRVVWLAGRFIRISWRSSGIKY
jgi:hypothetical protein